MGGPRTCNRVGDTRAILSQMLTEEQKKVMVECLKNGWIPDHITVILKSPNRENEEFIHITSDGETCVL